MFVWARPFSAVVDNKNGSDDRFATAMICFVRPGIAGACAPDCQDLQGESAIVFFAAEDVATQCAHACADQGTFLGFAALVTDGGTSCCSAESADGGAAGGVGSGAARAVDKDKTCENHARNVG